MRPFDVIRQALTEAVGARGVVTDRVWGYLMREGHVAAVHTGEHDIAWLTERAKNFLEATGRWSETPPDRREPMLSASTRIGTSMLVLSRLVAKEAADRDDVKWFRETVLKGRLLDPDEVGSWVLQREHKPARPCQGMAMSFEGPDEGVDFGADFKVNPPVTVTRIIGGQWRTLEYAVPGDEYVKIATTRAITGDLARLRSISEGLASDYDWQKAQATLFVLTGQIPVLPSFRWSITNRWPGPRRMTMNIDLILSPKELAARYAEIRRALRPEKSRQRELSQKHLTLAMFITGRDDKEPWAERLRAWNARYPSWRYSAASNFRRDAGRAIEKIRAPIVSGHDVMMALHGDGPKDSRRRSAKPMKRS